MIRTRPPKSMKPVSDWDRGWLLTEIRRIVREEIERALSQRRREEGPDILPRSKKVSTAILLRQQQKSVHKKAQQDGWIQKLKSQEGIPDLVRLIVESICSVNGWRKIPKTVSIRPVTEAYAAVKFLMENGMSAREIEEAMREWSGPSFETSRRFVMMSRPIQLKEKMPRIIAILKSMRSQASANDFSHVNPRLLKVLSELTAKPPDDLRLLRVADEIQSYYRQSPLWNGIRKESPSYERLVRIYGTDEAMMISWYGEWLRNRSWVKNSERLPLSFFAPRSSQFQQWNEENSMDWGCGKL